MKRGTYCKRERAIDNPQVLSVIAQQILTINKAKRAGVEKFHFEGTYMKINANANTFITMNPGYAGRAELPDNLKALFRPCAMMVPDYTLISEIRLYSFGFEYARENAQKLVRVLQLCSEQLSSQKHYDYGMRAVNSILVRSGVKSVSLLDPSLSTRRSGCQCETCRPLALLVSLGITASMAPVVHLEISCMQVAAGNLRQKLGDDDSWTEARIVLRSVNDINLPKFTVEDLPLFMGITSDLFPGVELGGSDHGPLSGAIDTACEEGVIISPGRTLKLIPTPSWKKKAIQLYEMVLVRHGVMVVGQTGSGKTTTVHALASAMTRCFEEGFADFPRVQVRGLNIPEGVKSYQLK